MKQLAQRMRDGELRVVDVPLPAIDDWKVLVRTQASLVSPGTERAKVEIARESLLGKARRRPDQVRGVLDKIRTDGLRPTMDAVKSRLEALSPLGYCATGRVEEVGALVRDISVGDTVACGGEESAHAEWLAVPANLCVPVPREVSPTEAAFTTLGSIALHGFRQAGLRVGERVAIVGMGLVGQLTARLARAAGCQVLGVDLEDWRLEIADRAGTIDFGRRRAEVHQTDMDTWDVVIVTAGGRTNDPVSLAADLARERGRIVIVGDVRLQLDRQDFYAKELELRLARSYGAGRYDAEYEQRGLDYPLPYVRWTERRNMAEFVRLVSTGQVKLGDLITHRFEIQDGPLALDLLTQPESRALGVLIEYPQDEKVAQRESKTRQRRAFTPGPAVGFIGAGSFARRHLIPLAKEHGLLLDRVATASGLSAVSAAEQFGFRRGACTVRELLDDDSISGVVIATRHDQHARLVMEALQAGKAVFVEKPLCLNEEDLNLLREELEGENSPRLMVGFNRRFAPFSTELRHALTAAPPPTNVLVRVNAGVLPRDHWLNDANTGGGRLLGEACHFVDLVAHFVDAEPIAVIAQGEPSRGEPIQNVQDFSISIRFEDGSLGTIFYGTAGNSSVGKELVEVHRGEVSGRIDDFQKLRIWGAGRRLTRRSRQREKGHSQEIRHFASVVRGEAESPRYETYLTSTALTLGALHSLSTGAEERMEDSSESEVSDEE